MDWRPPRQQRMIVVAAGRQPLLTICLGEVSMAWLNSILAAIRHKYVAVELG
jgi:hypothetical protein